MSADASAAGLRHLPLAGAVNFRDLGGYETTDGRRLRWGRLFRADALAALTEADLEAVEGLGLRTVCDLRSEPERERHPNLTLPFATSHAIGFEPYRGEALIAEVREGSISLPEIEARVREMYRRFVTEQTGPYTRLLQLLAGANALPFLFHCTSGRDRTGFGSAVVLLALGVPRATIATDYALSNHYRRDLTFHIGSTVSAETMTVLTQAHPDYLAASFAAIDELWGSDARYLREGLGLDAATQEQLKSLLLE